MIIQHSECIVVLVEHWIHYIVVRTTGSWYVVQEGYGQALHSILIHTILET